MRCRGFIYGAVLLSFACAGLTPATAKFPEKPITLIVTYSPGGEADVQMRIVARHLEKEFGVPFIVKNVVGAGGQLGWDEVVRTKADGYTWVNYNLPQVIIQPAVRKTAYSIDNLEPLIFFRDDPSVLAVRKDDPVTLKELLDSAKASPGKLPIAVTGKWTQHHLSFLFLESAAKVQLGEVNVDGQSEVNRLLLGGHVKAGFGNSSAFYRMQDQVRIIAVAASDRHKTLPGSATFQEQGVGNVLSSVIMGLAVAKDTPAEIVEDVSARLYKIFESNEALRSDLDKAGAPPVLVRRVDAVKLVKQTQSNVLQTLKERGIKTLQ